LSIIREFLNYYLRTGGWGKGNTFKAAYSADAEYGQIAAAKRKPARGGKCRPKAGGKRGRGGIPPKPPFRPALKNQKTASCFL